jgi:hypothetical protein
VIVAHPHPIRDLKNAVLAARLEVDCAREAGVRGDYVNAAAWSNRAFETLSALLNELDRRPGR